MRPSAMHSLCSCTPAACGGVLAAALMMATGAASAQDASGMAEEIGRVEQSIEDTTDLRQQLDQRMVDLNREVAELRAESINASLEIMAQHQVLLEIERAMTVLEAEEDERIAVLDVQRDKLSLLLGGLTRLARIPPETMVARPSAPVEALRTATLLRAAVPEIEAEARILREQLSELAAVRSDLADRRDQANTQREALDLRIEDMNALISRREALMTETQAEQQTVEARLQRLADEAETLRDLLIRLEEEAPVEEPVPEPVAETEPEPEPTPAEREAAAVAAAIEQGRELVNGQVASRLSALPVFDGVILPASGEIVLRYGQPNGFGETNRGLTLRPYPGAPVVAPLDGEVRFSGIFKGYGVLLILEHSGGYHSLIAGFGRLDARVGQQVLAGEPVGVTALPQSGTTDNPTLYFEFRSNGQPINPVQGLAMARESVRG